jgi:hypothetical protein
MIYLLQKTTLRRYENENQIFYMMDVESSLDEILNHDSQWEWTLRKIHEHSRLAVSVIISIITYPWCLLNPFKGFHYYWCKLNRQIISSSLTFISCSTILYSLLNWLAYWLLITLSLRSAWKISLISLN